MGPKDINTKKKPVVLVDKSPFARRSLESKGVRWVTTSNLHRQFVTAIIFADFRVASIYGKSIDIAERPLGKYKVNSLSLI